MNLKSNAISYFAKSACFIVLLTMVAEGFGQGYPIVMGKIEGLSPTTIFLYANDSKARYVDSSYCSDGKFRLKLKRLKNPLIGTLYYRNDKGQREPFGFTLILENRTIEVNFTLNDRKSIVVKNSEETRIYFNMLRDLHKDWIYIDNVRDSLARGLKISPESYKKVLSNLKMIIRKYAETYPKSFAVVLIISGFIIEYECEEVEAMMGRELKSNPYASKFRYLYALKKGKRLPLTVRDTSFVESSLLPRLKRNTLLIAWFVGCPPCRKELSYLGTIDVSKLPFDIVTLSVDEDRKLWRDYLTKIKWSKQNYLWDAKVAKKSGVHKYPTSIMIDKNGVVLDPDFDAYSIK